MGNRKDTPLVSNPPPLKTSTCPLVADLIDFARGQTATEIDQQVRHHLLTANCSFCRSWVDQAARQSGSPPIDWTKWTMTAPASLSSPPPTSDPTPVPENAKWQRHAFRELEGRLALLEEI